MNVNKASLFVKKKAGFMTNVMGDKSITSRLFLRFKNCYIVIL